MKKQTPTDNAEPGLQRDPDEWKTGDEPMTAAQRSYLETLCRETVVVEARDVGDEVALACCCHTVTTDQTGRYASIG
jgi:hypothetical protein